MRGALDLFICLAHLLMLLLSTSGHDPSRLFQRSVNKRHVPDYYDIIKEPMALSILKQKINKREYLSFEDFVRDCALVRTPLVKNQRRKH